VVPSAEEAVAVDHIEGRYDLLRSHSTGTRFDSDHPAAAHLELFDTLPGPHPDTEIPRQIDKGLHHPAHAAIGVVDTES
jgi:hypothetical protein